MEYLRDYLANDKDYQTIIKAYIDIVAKVEDDKIFKVIMAKYYSLSKQLEKKLKENNIPIEKIYYKDCYVDGKDFSTYYTNILKIRNKTNAEITNALYIIAKIIKEEYKTDLTANEIVIVLFYNEFITKYYGFDFEYQIKDYLAQKGIFSFMAKDLDDEYKIDLIAYFGLWRIGIQCKSETFDSAKVSYKDKEYYHTKHQKAIDDDVCDYVIFAYHSKDSIQLIDMDLTPIDKYLEPKNYAVLEEVKRLIDMLEQLKEDNKKDPN